MANSPTYSWREPDDSDYVKDGALAMRELGDDIDSTMNKMENYKLKTIHPFLLMGA